MSSSLSSYILLDHSGSMSYMWRDAVDSINSYVAELKKDSTDDKITFALFDSNSGKLDINYYTDDLSIDKWNDLSYSEFTPRGGTPLNDALAHLVNKALLRNEDKVVIVVMTDGHENASSEYTADATKKLLDKARDRGWQVLFLGAEFDNTSQAQGYGNSLGSTIQASAANLGSTMSWTASSARSFAAGTNSNINYTDSVRSMAASKTKANTTVKDK